MRSIYIEISQRIRGECDELERVIQRALRAWPQAQKSVSEQEVYLDSVALNLHSFYSGLERIFELIARHIDRSIPDFITVSFLPNNEFKRSFKNSSIKI